MKKLLLLVPIFLICYSCTQPIEKIETAHLNKYTLTIYQDKFDPTSSKFAPNNIVDSVKEGNDTVAYLNALKRFYNQKIIERQNSNYGQPKSFLIVDKNGIDLSVKLSDKMVSGLKRQVESTPDVNKMLEDYKKDSL